MTNEEFNREYHALVHAMQSGVAMEMNYDASSTEPKHLRVGVNVAIVEQSALWKLLVDKGLVSLDEMHEAILAAHRDEVASYEAELSERLGTKITLA
jgi:hypothetical protein